ncbi:MAG: hypothetical protein ACREJ3_06360, partial [Polyangiaceae bacterium]
PLPMRSRHGKKPPDDVDESKHGASRERSRVRAERCTETPKTRQRTLFSLLPGRRLGDDEHGLPDRQERAADREDDERVERRARGVRVPDHARRATPAASTLDYRYRGEIDLVYIDPPFMVNSDFMADNAIDIELDNDEGVQAKKEPSLVEILTHKDTWRQGLDSFLSMLRERLVLRKDPRLHRAREVRRGLSQPPTAIDGRRVIVQLREDDPDTGGQYTLKRWRVTKYTDDGGIASVELRPDNPDFKTIKLSAKDGEIRPVAEFLEIVTCTSTTAARLDRLGARARAWWRGERLGLSLMGRESRGAQSRDREQQRWHEIRALTTG